MLVDTARRLLSSLFRLLSRFIADRSRSGSGGAEQSPRWTDLRLVPVAGIVWLLSWVGIRLTGMAAIFWGMLMLGLAFGIVIWHFGFAVRGFKFPAAGRRWPKIAAAAVLSLAVGGIAVLSAYGQSAQRESDPLHQAVVQRMSLPLTLVLDENPRSSGVSGRVSATGRVLRASLFGTEIASNLRVEISANTDWSAFRRGEVLQTVGSFIPTESGNPMTARMSARGTVQRIGEAPIGTAWLSRLREEFVATVQQVWGNRLPDAAALLPGIVFGDRSRQSPELLAAMKTTGLTHLTAVSGTNCSIVLAGIILLARSCRLPRVWSAGLAAVGLLGFVSLVGFDPSVLRAAFMGSLGVLALLSGRPGQAGPLLCVVTTALLLIDPWLSGSFGFVLSVLATAGLIALGPPLRLWLGRWLPDWFAALLSIPLSAQLAVAPVIVLLQPRLTSYAVPANLLAAPVVVLCTVLGILGLLLLVPLPGVAMALIAVAGLGTGWIALIAGFFQGLPGAALPWWDGWPGVIAMAVLSAGILLLLAALGGTLVFRRKLMAVASRVPGVSFLLVGMSRCRRLLGWTVAVAVAAFFGRLSARGVLELLVPLPP